ERTGVEPGLDGTGLTRVRSARRDEPEHDASGQAGSTHAVEDRAHGAHRLEVLDQAGTGAVRVTVVILALGLGLAVLLDCQHAGHDPAAEAHEAHAPRDISSEPQGVARRRGALV